jgi:hypothetical protein
VALPRQPLGAHSGGALLADGLDQALCTLPEFLRHHVIGVGTEPGVPQRSVLRVFSRPAPSAERCSFPEVADSRSGQRFFQRRAGEVRMAA